MIVAAADGSSLSNPGPSGWAWYISDDAWAAGGWEHGTNNMGELMAVLDLLRSTEHLDEPLRVLCDSRYVIDSLTKWLPGWKRRGWKKGDGKPVLNVELMKQLDEALSGRDVDFQWVKGHAGHRMNEAADERARAAAMAYLRGREPDRGPGFPDRKRPVHADDFVVGQTEEQPDLFSEPEASPATPGSASVRAKAELTRLTGELLSRAVRTNERRLAEYLHPEFVAHSVDGEVIDASHGAWEPTQAQFEVLSIDQYADGVVGVRWRQGDRLRFSLWQKLPGGWRLRFAQVTPAAEA